MGSRMLVELGDVDQFLRLAAAVRSYRAAGVVDPAVRDAMLEHVAGIREAVGSAVALDTPLGRFLASRGYTFDDLDLINVAVASGSREVSREAVREYGVFLSGPLSSHRLLARLRACRVVEDGYVSVPDPFRPAEESAEQRSLLDLLASDEASEPSDRPLSVRFEPAPHRSFDELALDVRSLGALVSPRHGSLDEGIELFVEARLEALRASYGLTLETDADFARFLSGEEVSFEEMLLLVVWSSAYASGFMIRTDLMEGLTSRFVPDEAKRSLVRKRLLTRNHFGDFEPTPRALARLTGAEGTDSDGIVKAEEPTETFEDVCLPDKTMRAIRTVIDQERNGSRIFDEWGIRSSKAITLNFVGPPGTGKTLSARAVAHELGKRLLVVNFAELESMWVGQTEKNIESAFRTAREQDAVLFFDEADSLTTARENADRAWIVSRTNTLLKELEAFEGVCVFATNFPGNYDRAFNRRLSAHIEFELPDAELLARIFRSHVPKAEALSGDVDFDAIASLAAGVFSGGDVKNVVLNAARIAAAAGSETMRRADFEEACGIVLSGKRVEAESLVQSAGTYIG